MHVERVVMYSSTFLFCLSALSEISIPICQVLKILQTVTYLL